MIFEPFCDCVEVEPIEAPSVIAGGFEKIEAARIVGISPANMSAANVHDLHTGDIIFFRPHGFFELPEYEGKRRYVVKIAPEYILGILRA